MKTTQYFDYTRKRPDRAQIKEDWIQTKKMIARISTHFVCTETDLWLKIVEPKSLQFVAPPILSFIPDEAGTISSARQYGGHLCPGSLHNDRIGKYKLP